MNVAEVKFATKDKPWLKYLPAGASEKPLPQCSIYKWLKECNHNNLSTTAINYYGTKISYRQLITHIDQYASAFNEFGIKRGEYVSFLSVILPETVFSIYGLNKIGAMCNFIDVRTDVDHIIEYVKKAKSKVLICVDSAFPKISQRLDELEVEKVILQDPGDSLRGLTKLSYRLHNKNELPKDKRLIRNREVVKLGRKKQVAESPYQKDYPAVITRTGGTTGTSKGVIITNDSLNGVAANFADYGFEYKKGEKLLNFLPVGASYGIACGVHMAFCLGMTNTLIPNFNPAKFAELVLKYKPNHIIGVPVFYENLMLDEKAQKTDLSFISTMAAGGDSANAALEKKLREFGASHGIKYPLAQGYGMSESSSACCFGVQNIHKDGSVGIPAPHSMLAVFKPGTTEELPIGESGEICITGATLMSEYLDEPEETENVMIRHPDGKVWVHSGDIGHMDEDGFLFIEGRIKRSVIRFDGHKVYPVQLETVAAHHPGVKNVCVVACKDLTHEQGHLPIVVVELLPEYKEKEKDICTEIMDICQDGMETRSWPCAVVTIDQMPITNIGKNDAMRVEKQFADYDYMTGGKK